MVRIDIFYNFISLFKRSVNRLIINFKNKQSMKRIFLMIFMAFTLFLCGVKSYATDVGSPPLPYGINSVNKVEISGMVITSIPEQVVVQNRQVECIANHMLYKNLIGTNYSDVGQQISIVSYTQNNDLNFSQSGNSFCIDETKLIVINPIARYKYEAVTRKFLMTSNRINLSISAATNTDTLIADPCWFKSWIRNQKVS